jgi:hypothetical protein
MGSAEQHGLRFERNAALAVRQHLRGDVARLLALIAHADQLRPLGRGAIGPEVLGEALVGELDHCIRRRQDRLRRAVVALERRDVGGRREVSGEVEDVADRGGAERVDRLGVVADHGEAAARGLEREQDRRLQPVGVLILVDQHVIEALGDIGGNRRLRHHLRPVEQEIVVVEHVLALLGLDISGEQRPQLRLPMLAPGEVRAQHLVERQLRVHRARIDREAGALGGKARLGLGEAEIVPDQIDEIRGILTVVDGESAIEPDLAGVFPEKPRADRVERAGPGQ